MSEDPIVAETRAARERLVARFNGDLDALWRHLQEVQKDNVASELTFNDPKGIELTLKSLDANHAILAAAVYDKAGATATVSRKQPLQHLKHPPLLCFAKKVCRIDS